MQLKTQLLKQVPLGRVTCINLQVFATGDIITDLFLNQDTSACTSVVFIRKQDLQKSFNIDFQWDYFSLDAPL